MRRKRYIWLGVSAATVLVVSIIPIIHPIRFFWAESDFSIIGYVLPDGGERGIHYYDARVDARNRIRALAIDFRIVAWELTLTEQSSG